jgi:hypothetical protein
MLSIILNEPTLALGDVLMVTGLASGVWLAWRQVRARFGA